MKLGVFTRIVLRNLFSKPATRLYPAEPRIYPERTRGAIGIDIDACIFCGICSKKCPTGAITVTKADMDWTIRRFGCIQCGACTEACPKKCLTMLTQYTTPDAQKTVESFRKLPKEPETPVSKED